MSFFEFTFWVGSILIIYVYAGYGCFLMIAASIKGKPIQRGPSKTSVTIIVAAYNEEQDIKNKLDNILALDYPGDLINIIVGSDESSDRTDEIVMSYPDKRVQLLRVEGRQGKTAVQNACAEKASGTILVFTDATTDLHKRSLSYLVENFNDPDVGCVGAKLIYANKNESEVGEGGVSYWSYETAIKTMESRLSSLIGVSGCYYAVRKSLYTSIPADLISDFVIAMDIYKKGYRVVFDERATCEETTLDDSRDEYSMRVRVAIRSYGALWRMRSLLNPVKHGLYAIQLLSHKVLRYLVGVFAIVVYLSNLFLLNSSFYLFIFVLQNLFYLLALFVLLNKGSKKNVGLLSIPSYLVLANYAATVALIKFLNGQKITVWTPQR